MSPTFLPGDRLLVLPWRPSSSPPEKGEVVVARDPEQEGRLLLKRVAGIERTAGEGRRSELLVDLRGDHEAESRDSRAFGPVPVRAIVGRVWFRYLPEERRGFVPTEEDAPGAR